MKEVVDLFEEEMLKEDKKELKRIEKEKSRQKRYEKKLEKIEDEEFAKMLKEDKKVKEDDFEEIVKEEKDNEVNEKIVKEKKHSILNFLLGLSIIVLFLASSDYAIYNIIKGKDLEQVLTSSALCITSIFYILSIIVKNTTIKKIFEILATLSIAAYMCYYLFLA